MTATNNPALTNPNIAKMAIFAFHIRINLPSVGGRDRTQNIFVWPCRFASHVMLLGHTVKETVRVTLRSSQITWL